MMDPNRRRKSARTLAGWLLPVVLVAPLAAQEEASARVEPSLDTLLAQLAKTAPEVWDARAAAMRSAAAKAREEAKVLREQSKAKVAEAERKEGVAKGLDAEVGKLGKVREVLATLQFRDPAGEGERAESEQGKLEAALSRLTSLPAAAWEARVAAMKETAQKGRDGAKGLREAAAKLGGQADGKDAAAKALDEETEKLKALRAMLAGLRIDTIASAPVAPAAAAAAAEKESAPAPAKAAPEKEAPAPMPAAAADDEPEERLVTYDDHVFDIFDLYCVTCHDPTDASGGLDLSTHASALVGGGSGRTIRPGNADGSRLYMLVSHKERPTMPPDEPRIDEELIETIRLWIAQGAPKDLAQAKKLAAERKTARAKAVAEAAEREKARGDVQVVMPERLPGVEKAYPDRPGPLRAVAASPGAPLIAVPGFGQVLLLHADGLRELGVLEFPFGSVERLSFSGDGARLLVAGGVAGRAGGAVLYDVRTGAEIGRYGEQRDAVLGAGVSPDGSLVAVGGTRRRVEVFVADGGDALWQGSHDEWVTDVAFSPDGALLASADRAGNVLVREAANGREVHTLTGHDGGVTAVAFSPDSALLATAGVDRTVRVFRMKDGGQAWSQRAHGDDVLCVTWRSSTRLLSGGADGRVVHWRSDGKRDPDLPPLGEWIYDVAATPDGALALVGDWGGRLVAIDLEARKIAAEVVPLAVAQ